jgi:phosphatidylglycerol:prolipoprotein diacylglycerol transferase
MKPALLTYPYISSYPVLMLLGFVFGWLLARRRARLYGIDPRHLDNISLLLPGAGLFGARFFARLFYAKVPLLEALKVWKGDGLVFYGGFLCAAAVVIGYAVLRRLSLRRLCDCLAPSVAVGLAFGRVGCFLAGCCWGDFCVADNALAGLDPAAVRQVHTIPAVSRPGWPLAVRFPPGSEPFKQQVKLGVIAESVERSLPVHPVQLYEAALAGVLAIWLHRKFRGGERPGAASLALMAGYAVIRFATEYLRADNRPYALGLTISQMISVEILLFCVAAVTIRRFFRSVNQGPSEQTKSATHPVAVAVTRP